MSTRQTFWAVDKEKNLEYFVTAGIIVGARRLGKSMRKDAGSRTSGR